MLRQTEEYRTLDAIRHRMDFIHESMECGHLIIDVDSPEEVYLWSLEIYEGFRGNGLSHILMQDIINHVTQCFPTTEVIRLRVVFENEKAQHVYLKAGFQYVNKIEVLTLPGEGENFIYVMEYKYGNKN